MIITSKDSRDMELAAAAAATAFAIQTLELHEYQRKKEDMTIVAVAGNKKHTRKTLEGAFRGSKADAWERAQIQKITKWNEKMTSTIISWEREKKERAKRQMERRKGEIERSKARNMQHYHHKIANIENVAGGAIVHVEQRTASKQSEVKDKANKIPPQTQTQTQTYCFCF